MTTVTVDIRQGLHSGIAYKAPCRVATTANITLSGLQTIDGVALAADDRVLVKNQTAGSENGIFVASTSTWQRAQDWNGVFDVKCGTQVRVCAGATGAVAWYVSTSDPITVGVTSVAFTSVGLVDLSNYVGANGELIIPAPTAAVAAVTATGANGASVYVAIPNDTEAGFATVKDQNAQTMGPSVLNVNASANAASVGQFSNGTSALNVYHYGTGSSLANTSQIDATGAGGLIVRASHASGKIRFWPGGTGSDQWEIDEQGRLLNTGDTQLHSNAVGGGGGTNTHTGDTNAHEFGNFTAIINRASALNVTTGRFTAAVAGTYLCGFRVRSTQTDAVGPLCSIRKSGVATQGFPSATGVSSVSGIYDVVSSGPVDLAVNDYLSVWGVCGTANNIVQCDGFWAVLLF